MKKYSRYIGLLLVSVMIFSCNKENFNYKPGYVGISKITEYPTFTVNGNIDTSVVLGATYTDPGATAKGGSAELKVTSSGTVNTNKAGLYLITYSATNVDGFAGTTTRYVAVLPSAPMPDSDISGGYVYAAGGANATITKLAPGFYYVSNIWSTATTIPAYLICVDGKNIILPVQQCAYGELDGTAELSAHTSGATLNYTVNLGDQGIAGSVRKWLRQ